MSKLKAPQKLWQAYLSLLATHTADEVSVRMVCETAGLNRTTFYKHFRDLFALAEYGFSLVAAQAMMAADEARADLLSTRRLVDFFQQYRTELRHLSNTPYLYRMQQAMGDAAERHLLDIFTRYPESYRSEVPPPLMVQFYIGGMMKILLNWLYRADYAPEELTRHLDALARQVMNQMMPSEKTTD